MIRKPNFADLRGSRTFEAAKASRAAHDPHGLAANFSGPVGQLVFVLFLLFYSGLMIMTLGHQGFVVFAAVVAVPAILWMSAKRLLRFRAALAADEHGAEA